MQDLFLPVINTFRILWIIFTATWWLLVPFFLFLIFSDMWLNYVRGLFGRGQSWTVVEVKIPKEITRTPKAMEQVFAAASAMPDKVGFLDKWWHGKTPDRMSFEIVGYAGGVYFFVKCLTGYKNLVEASIYAQYPEAEINEANDYVELVPANLPNESFDLIGMDLVLAREDAYPIRTYEYFEDKEDERRLDPISAITEVMSKLKEGETMWIQIVIQKAGDDWKKKAEEQINKVIGIEPQAKPSVFAVFSELRQALYPPEKPEEKKQDKGSKLSSLTPNQRDVVKAMEEKAAKTAFKTTIRFIYVDHRDRFTRANVSAVIGALGQFNTQNLNALKSLKDTAIRGGWFWKEETEFAQKQALFKAYKGRSFAPKTSFFNTEELATLYHFPSLVVEAPRLQRIEAKKGEPPSNLPIG